MKRKRCRFCGSNEGCYRIDKRFQLKALIVAVALISTGIVGSITVDQFMPLGIILFMTGVISLVFIKEPKYYCRSCGSLRR